MLKLTPPLHSRQVLLGLIGCSLLLTACTPPEPTPTPTPTPEPTYQCTPIFGGDPTTCTQQDYGDLQARLAQYTEAGQLYRDSVFLFWELLAAKEPMTDELRATATDSYLEEITDSVEGQRTSNMIVSGQPEITWTEPAELTSGGSDFALRACVAPGTYRLEADGATSEGVWSLDEVFFRSTDEGLRISHVIARRVDKC